MLASLGGGGVAADAANAFALQARMGALETRWSEMVADGVDPANLAELRSQAAQVESVTWFGMPAAFLLPDTSVVLDRWEVKTGSVWAKAMADGRESALFAERRLQGLLPDEPAAARKDRLSQLADASTPAEYHELWDEWTLEADLVPIDRSVATAVGVVATLIDQARSLGILSEPGPRALAQAAEYVSLAARERVDRSQPLVRLLDGTAADLNARLAAARRAKQAFKQAADEISRGALYGVDVTGYEERVRAATRAYSTATTAAALDAVASDLTNNVVKSLQRAITSWMSKVHVIAGVAVYYQTHALSCEEAATSMALTHQGIHVSQDQILAAIGADRRPMYRDSSGRIRWGDPYVSFVGSVDGDMSNYTGYQANYPPLVRVSKAYGARILDYGYVTAATIYARLAAGHPVVAWATWDWAWHPRHDYIAFDGRSVPWIGPTFASHVYTVVGVRPDAVLVNDPMRGQYWVGKAAFEAAYSVFNEAIVFA
ncbi:MAG TPA: C39 family peptidase [Candidatus Dormibacteraeota bacterium]|nr:C39 family peptidase [Candidatus Dormibacteraeota bacterium]